MPYADGPSGSESANDWLSKTFRFGSRLPATKQVNDFFGSLGKIKYNGPNPQHLLGSLSYEGPGSNQSRPANKITTLPSKAKFTGWPAGRLSVDEPQYSTDRRGNGGTRQGSDDIPPSRYRDGDGESSLFDQLMAEFQSKWSGPDKSQIDYSPLDKALQARLGAIGNVRNQANQNFDKSDANLESMHRGFQNHISTEGANQFNQIADNAKGQLTGINADSAARLQAIKADDQAKRQQMLQALGIQASGAAPDESANALTQAQASIGSRNEAELANTEQDRATNLAYNQGIATSVGQQGVERRGELQQQLQSILGKLGMAEADATQEDAMARYELEQNQGNQQYQQWRDRQGFLGDTLGMLQDDAQKMAEAQSKGSDVKINGFSGLAQDLVNTGYQVPEIQGAMGALSNILAGDYMKGVDPNAGYARTDILNKLLQREGVDPMLAIQLATNYGNLGNTSSYQAMR